MTQYEFMKNWCKARQLEPELHWPAAQRAWDKEQPLSGDSSPESAKQESGDTNAPGSLEDISQRLQKTNRLVSQLEGRIRIMDAQIKELMKART
jgi:hypothetical protein